MRFTHSQNSVFISSVCKDSILAFSKLYVNFEIYFHCIAFEIYFHCIAFMISIITKLKLEILFTQAFDFSNTRIQHEVNEVFFAK